MHTRRPASSPGYFSCSDLVGLTFPRDSVPGTTISTMDSISELEVALDTLIKVMASAVAYLSRKAAHKQVNTVVPLTVLGTPESVSDDVLAAQREELVQGLVKQAKDVEQCIQKLPHFDHVTDQVRLCTQTSTY